MTDIKLPFGLKGDTLIHISQAVQGLACDCLCPACKEPLVARKGAVTIHHFAHHNGHHCASAVETALHLASKHILADRREIMLPPVYVCFDSYRDPVLVSPAKSITLDDVREEYRTGQIVPDLLVSCRTIPLMIEIQVTHRVDEAKLGRIRSLGISAIEIDLSLASRDFSPAKLADAVVSQCTNKKWLFNAKAERLKRLFLATGKRKPVIRRGFALHVDHCPVRARVWRGKPYANLIDDCLNCEFVLEVAPNNKSIVCGAAHKIKTVDELLSFHRIVGLRAGCVPEKRGLYPRLFEGTVPFSSSFNHEGQDADNARPT